MNALNDSTAFADDRSAHFSVSALNASTPSVIGATQAARLPRGVPYAVLNAALRLRSEQWLAERHMSADALNAADALPIGGATGGLSDALDAAVSLKSLGVARGFRAVAYSDLPLVLERGLHGDGSAFHLSSSSLLTKELLTSQKRKLLATGACELSHTLAGWVNEGVATDHPVPALQLFENQAGCGSDVPLVFLSMQQAFDSFQGTSMMAVEERAAGRCVVGSVVPCVVVVFDIVSTLALQHLDVPLRRAELAPMSLTPNRFASALGSAARQDCSISPTPLTRMGDDVGNASVGDGADAFISQDSQQCAVLDHRQLLPRFVVHVR